MSNDRSDILQRALKRERLARKESERILEIKSSELYELTQDLQRANKQLKASVTEKNSQLQGIFTNILDAYVVMDLAGNILRMNESAEQLLDYSLKDGRKNLLDFVAADDIRHTQESYNSLRENGMIENFEVRLSIGEGLEKWVQINASLIYDFNKRPVAAQGIARDITESMADKQLIENQKRELDIIVDNSSLGIILAEDQRIIKANQAFCDLLGYEETELVNMRISDLTLPQDMIDSKKLLDGLESGDISEFSQEKRYKRKDHSVVWARTKVSMLSDIENKVKYQVAIVEDITAEREKSLMINVINEVAKAILGEIDLYRIAWEIVHRIAEYLNADDCVIYIVDHRNGQLEQIAAFGAKAPSGEEVIDQIIIPLGQGIVGSVASSGQSEIIKNTDQDPRYIVDDAFRLSEITVPILSNGKVIAVIDSEHKDADYFTTEHLKALHNVANLVSMQIQNALNLQERLKAERRSKELLEQLEASNAELEEYAHIVSHDLKSPLRNIYALVDWIKQDNKVAWDEKTLRNFDLIGKTLEKMEGLITGILSYSSINNESFQSKEIHVDQVITDALQLLHVPSHIEIIVDDNFPKIKGDQTRLIQLYQNLIGNAIRYTDKEQGQIRVFWKEVDGQNVFGVADNGVGIDSIYHEKIFKIFESLSDIKESTGVGLSIVKKIIDLHQGRIWLESGVGTGTTFYFTLNKKPKE
ncbi:PAS domain-containing sensor histidine kinase [Aureitalea marina]|uniref:histidine kinase n=1 Tax=Aureitalea marina TaxID=930804 RepID=A0A2S7KLI1_9FLAO|nr:PAS domain S-box protein [Aureitalea marina]PQB03486.1 histidine kinase [Aureitalea marina]